jgi:hypothetical protein
MNLRDTIKRILKEESKTKGKKEVEIIRRLLDLNPFEGVCDYVVTYDRINDRVGAVILRFSEEWYRSSDETVELNRKLKLIRATKDEVEKLINNYTGLKNIYVGYVYEKCDSSLKDN